MDTLFALNDNNNKLSYSRFNTQFGLFVDKYTSKKLDSTLTCKLNG